MGAIFIRDEESAEHLAGGLREVASALDVLHAEIAKKDERIAELEGELEEARDALAEKEAA